MLDILQAPAYAYKENITLKEQLEIEEDAVNNLFLMNSPWPILVVLATYLYFVLKVGPQYMLNRKAYSLKGFMVSYNLLQVLYNGFFIAWLLTSGLLPFLMHQSCYPETQADLPSRLLVRNVDMSALMSSGGVPYLLLQRWQMACKQRGSTYIRKLGIQRACTTWLNVSRTWFLKGAWVWFLLKVIDLSDTVIFILRKKQSQVSFLHVYHHTTVVLSTWLHIKYVRGEQSVAIGFVNSLVHAVMYTYYLLAALGPSVQPYLWWKRHITKLQLVQFVSLFGWFTYLTVGCSSVPFAYKVYNWFSISQAILFFILFMSFYFNAYQSPNKVKSS